MTDAQHTIALLRTLNLPAPLIARLTGCSVATVHAWSRAGSGYRAPPVDLRDRVVDGLRRLACQIEDLDPSA